MDLDAILGPGPGPLFDLDFGELELRALAHLAETSARKDLLVPPPSDAREREIALGREASRRAEEKRARQNARRLTIRNRSR